MPTYHASARRRSASIARAALSALALGATTSGCRSGGTSVSYPSITGLEFTATSGIRSSANVDTLAVAVFVRNPTKRTPELHIPTGCGAPTVIVIARMENSTHEWNSERWWKVTDSIAMAKARAAHTGPGPFLGRVCTTGLPTVTIKPGGVADFTAWGLDVRQILGDTLPEARYRIRVRPKGNGYEAGFLKAGDVDLRGPRGKG